MRYPDRLLRVRNSKHLNWHFRYPMLEGKIWIFACLRDAEIAAYGIFLRQDNPEIGLKRMSLIDLQSIEDASDIIMDIVSAGIRRCRQEKIDILEVIGLNAAKRSALESFNPHKRRLPSWPFLYKSRDEKLVKELGDHNAWDPSLFDGDSGI